MTVLVDGAPMMSQLVNRSMLVEDVPGFNSVDKCPGFDQLILRRNSLINAHFPIPSETVARSEASSNIDSTHIIRRPRG